MMFNPEKFEAMLGGTHVAFKKRERPPFSEQESELKFENDERIREGIRILRQERTLALEEPDLVKRQDFLKEAHQFSEQMAEVIIKQALGDKPSPIEPSYLQALQRIRSEYAEKDADSGHGLPPGFSVQNLSLAADDMLVRVQEKAQSFVSPDHKLTEAEMKYVLREFSIGTNDLTINAIEKLFEKNTKIGGILSGGSVYVEMVKKIVKRYGDPSLAVDSFVIAVDKENQKAVFESSETDAAARAVILADDVIDKGGTLLTALWTAGEQFPNATMYSGKGTDQPGGFEKRRADKHLGHLEMLFQDFYDLSEAGRKDEALALFRQAEKYAKENRVTLQAGWYSRKNRIEKDMTRI